MTNKRKIILLLTTAIFLSSCGVNTKNWPRLSFDFNFQDVEKIVLSIIKSKTKYTQSYNEELVVSEQNEINKSMNYLIGIPYKESQEDKVEKTDYLVKLDIVFSFCDTTIDDYKIVFYEYDIYDGNVIFNNGEIHFVVSDIESIYIGIKDELLHQ